jgi:hypothetical protein
MLFDVEQKAEIVSHPREYMGGGVFARPVAQTQGVCRAKWSSPYAAAATDHFAKRGAPKT